MSKRLRVEVVQESLGNDVIEIKSTTRPGVVYRVDTIRGRCSCPAWIHSCDKSKPCKHLRAMGWRKTNLRCN